MGAPSKAHSPQKWPWNMFSPMGCIWTQNLLTGTPSFIGIYFLNTKGDTIQGRPGHSGPRNFQWSSLMPFGSGSKLLRVLSMKTTHARFHLSSAFCLARTICHYVWFMSHRGDICIILINFAQACAARRNGVSLPEVEDKLEATLWLDERAFPAASCITPPQEQFQPSCNSM